MFGGFEVDLLLCSLRWKPYPCRILGLYPSRKTLVINTDKPK